MEFDTQHI